MTRKEFIKIYCDNSKITEEDFNKYWVAIPCTCEGQDLHWGVVSKNLDSILSHNMISLEVDIPMFKDLEE